MDPDDEEIQHQIAEALLRSCQETTREESLLADAMAASMISRDEELARALQREQLSQMEASLCRDLSADPPLSSAPSPPTVTATNSVNASAAGAGATTGATTTISPAASRAAAPSRPAHPPYQPTVVAAAASRKHSLSPACAPNPAHSSQAPSTYYTPPRLRRISVSPKSNSYAAAAATPVYSPPSLRPRNSPPAPRNSPPPAPHTLQPQFQPLLEPDPRTPVVVIDGQNIGCSYGGGRHKFRARGVELVLDYYRLKNIPAVAMLPACKVDERTPHARLADDPTLLRQLHGQGRVSFTPAGAHDDYFLLRYAMQVDADLISNDRFMKELDMQETVQDAKNLRSFLDSHLIPYTFVAGEFVPNPRPSQLGRDVHQSRTMRR